MPQIPDQLLDCVVYIFNSLDDARTGSRYGGTGFVAGVNYSNSESLSHGYIVTNEHVIHASVIQNKPLFARLNLASGGFDTIEIHPSSWVVEPGGDDLAVCPIDQQNKVFQIACIGIDMFVPHPAAPRARPFDEDEFSGVNLGDDVFMIGRYVDHQGTVRNLPTARFGNIAQLPHEPVLQRGRSHRQQCFLVEMRSASGFSGSPVFVATTLGMSLVKHFHLLGVDFGHLPLRGKVVNKNGDVSTTEFVEIDSMIACVVPAWTLRALLDDPSLIEQRRRDEEAEAAQQPHGAILDASVDEEAISRLR